MIASWPARAACAGMSTFLDFTPDKPDPYELDAALKVCGYCAVREQCLDAALADEDAAGVYGGQVLVRPRKLTSDRPSDIVCGTVQGAKRHYRRGEKPCEPCQEARRRDRDARNPITPKPCGTRAAYRRHQRHGETPCRACSDAENAYRRQIRQAS
jgi:hypothetical protein